MKIKVIKIIYNDKVSYLNNTGYNEDFCNPNPKTVDSPLNAIDYALPINQHRLEEDIYCFYITGVGGAKSGICADRIELVEFDVSVQEISSQPLLQDKTQ